MSEDALGEMLKNGILDLDRHLAQFLTSDESPWNYMMATAIIYAVPPVILYYGFRRYMAAGPRWAV